MLDLPSMCVRQHCLIKVHVLPNLGLPRIWRCFSQIWGYWANTLLKRLNLLKKKVISKIWDFRLNINSVVETNIHLATWLTVSCSVNLSTLFHLISLLFGGFIWRFPLSSHNFGLFGGFKAL